ncbi:MAG TPA: hypothetical protein VKD22_05860, partial [Ramlibacter sp.]|nr:hypothetical protein [Ramlibacter sp.]
SLANEVAPMPGEVRRAALRTVLTGALIHATDSTRAPADIALSAHALPQALLLTLTLRPTDGEPSFSADPPYRPLEWADLEALAAAEGVQLTREGPLLLRIALAWVASPTAATAA